MKCVVCFDEHEKFIKCADTSCKDYLCFDCFEMYLNHNNSELPACVSKKCNKYYIYSDIDNAHKELYTDVLHRAINKSNVIYVDKKDIIKQLQDKKIQFILNNYPKSINKVALICMKKKLYKIYDKVDDKVEK